MSKRPKALLHWPLILELPRRATLLETPTPRSQLLKVEPGRKELVKVSSVEVTLANTKTLRSTCVEFAVS